MAETLILPVGTGAGTSSSFTVAASTPARLALICATADAEQPFGISEGVYLRVSSTFTVGSGQKRALGAGEQSNTQKPLILSWDNPDVTISAPGVYEVDRTALPAAANGVGVVLFQ